MKYKDHSSITFLDSRKVLKLHRDPNDYEVELDELMELSLQPGEVATDLFVLDGIVAVRINDNKFRFFIEPLVVRDPIEPLALDDFQAQGEIFADPDATIDGNT